MKKLVMIGLVCLTLSGCSEQVHDESSIIENIKQINPLGKWSARKDKSVVDGVTYYGDTLIVNKNILLPADYAPGENAEARTALERLMSAGSAEGLHYAIRSGYRSYAEQDALYHSYVARDGKEAADKYSAEPGHSEHQTGLAFDLGSRESVKDFTISFGDTPEGKWLQNHAHLYGFIIRYPEGKTRVTGYQYEPWHIRYVGKNLAQTLYKSKLTLEEYYGIVKPAESQS
ncbi:D-alanyl-D-alanine carboxypeptidase family protein [Macrococcus hajekii]|uniref:D-alanyl-D-alanine carboxypeptidase family protein n=1 Tax=Macrococcus hajekii TaxID=198482 RepID=A0A4R6BI76_9STAP|nr:M15 family metallopeptidase [Macrococcus hajekii]TDM01319.1 D-alanyl-D-alanine carboxypeptidase family protein [Macrococcus hajekii]GGB10661.1 D-Ala-D-Ala carboxypeptidase [Macrococcus hajekii]